MENYLILFVSFFLGLIIKGIVGFGEPLFISPILSFIYSNQIITPNMLVVSLPLNFYFFIKNYKEIKLKKILPMLTFVIIGGIIGIGLLSYADSSIIKILLGVLIIFIGLEMFVRSRIEKTNDNKKPSMILLSLVSLASGITAGLYNINMFIIAYLEKTSTNRNDFRANSCFIFFAESLIRLGIYIYAGFFTKEVLMTIAVSLPAACLGFGVGQLFDKNLDEKKVKLFTIIIFILGGLSIILNEIL